DQDLFVLQTALIVLPPDTVFVSILDRFGHTGYFAGANAARTLRGRPTSPWLRNCYTSSSSSWVSAPPPLV
ncbi:hypothetical protein B0H14DRAFT_2387860, partial [Mycena olivaceomarginata]